MNDVSIDRVVSDNYLEYGKYVNKFRSIPGLDGLKPVQRRVMIASRKEAKSMIKTVGVIGEVIKKWHPHGDASVVPVVSWFVRQGFLKGQGNHGAYLLEKLPEAAPRYTEVQYNESLDDILFKLERYAPHFDNELGNSEPEYLILPLPIALITGTSGIGLGVTTRIPAFDPASLWKAYQKDDPNYLRSRYGYEMISCDLKKLWDTGVGRMTLSYKVSYEYSKDDGCNVNVITGKGDLFTLALGKLKEYLEQGRIFIRNESKKNVRLVIGRTKGTKLIADEELHKLCKDLAKFTRSYDIRVNINGVVRRIGIKSWLDKCFKLYESNFEKWKEEEVSRLTQVIEEYRLIPKVVDCLNKNMNNRDIGKQLNIGRNLVSSILSKPLKLLRKNDFDYEINEINKSIKHIKTLNAKSTVEDVLSKGAMCLR